MNENLNENLNKNDPRRLTYYDAKTAEGLSKEADANKNSSITASDIVEEHDEVIEYIEETINNTGEQTRIYTQKIEELIENDKINKNIEKLKKQKEEYNRERRNTTANLDETSRILTEKEESINETKKEVKESYIDLEKEYQRSRREATTNLSKKEVELKAQEDCKDLLLSNINESEKQDLSLTQNKTDSSTSSKSQNSQNGSHVEALKKGGKSVSFFDGRQQ